jgi:hypothetical protein
MMSSAFEGFVAWVIDDITRALGAKLDALGLVGAGSASFQPLGLFDVGMGVPEVAVGPTGGPMTRAILTEMERTVSAASGDSGEVVSLGWITSPAGRKKLRNTDASSANAARWLWEDGGSILDSPAQWTTAVPSNWTKSTGTALTGLLFGNFAELIINLFTAVDVVINPYQESAGGACRISAFLDADVKPRHLESFCRCRDMGTT